MATSFVRHRVNDYDAWRKVYDSVGDLQKAGGVVEEAVYQAEGDPNEVLVMHRFESTEAAHAYFENADLKQALEDAGVDLDSLRLELYQEA